MLFVGVPESRYMLPFETFPDESKGKNLPPTLIPFTVT